MTMDEERRPRDSAEERRPPFSRDLLADLHAGVLDDDLAVRLWPLVRADPEASDFLARLDATRGRLAALRDAPPSEEMPAEVARRIGAALAAERSAPARGAAYRRWFTAAGVGLAAAVAVILVIVVRGTAFGSDGSVPPLASAEEAAVLESSALRAMIGHTGLGPLAEEGRLRECLSANGFDDGRVPLGSREVRYREHDAVLLLLSGPESPSLTALVVGTECSATDPATLAREEIG